MLVLCRKKGEAVVVPGFGVTVTVLKITGNRVKLGVDAPQNVAVCRKELLVPKDREPAAVAEFRREAMPAGLPNRENLGRARHPGISREGFNNDTHREKKGLTLVRRNRRPVGCLES